MVEGDTFKMVLLTAGTQERITVKSACYLVEPPGMIDQ